MKLIKLKNIISDLDNKIIHDIQIDKSLLVIKNKEEISEFEKHHIIPTWFEIIPHLTIKWTIKFIKKEKLKYKNNTFKIDKFNLYLNSEKVLYLTYEEHKKLHKYLDNKKQVFLDCVLINFNSKNIAIHSLSFQFISEKYKIFYADRQKRWKNNTKKSFKFIN